MIERDDLYNRLIFLVPDAMFSFWPDEGDNKGNDNVIIVDGWMIAWNAENNLPCPSLVEIQNVDQQQLDTFIAAKAKEDRNNEKKKDLVLVGLYNNAKIANPTLTFSDFLDDLEAMQGEL